MAYFPVDSLRLCTDTSPIIRPSEFCTSIPRRKVFFLKPIFTRELVHSRARTDKFIILAGAYNSRHDRHRRLLRRIVGTRGRLHWCLEVVPRGVDADWDIGLKAETGLPDARVPAVELRDCEVAEGGGD